MFAKMPNSGTKIKKNSTDNKETASTKQKMDDRSTAELMDRLGDDVSRCFDSIVDEIDNHYTDADGNTVEEWDFHARQLIRSVLAYIEAVTYSLKFSCLIRCEEEGIKINSDEKGFILEIKSILNNKGEITRSSSKINLASNIRFAFKLREKLPDNNLYLDVTSNWWKSLVETIKVRNRLMHPRLPQDIDLRPADILSAMDAYNGFNSAIMPNDA
jgi:hypothetical protein